MQEDEFLEKIKEIRRLDLRPDDIIVLRYDVKIRAETIDQITGHLRERLGLPNKIVVLDMGARLDILAPLAEDIVSEDDVRKLMQAAKANPGRVVSVDDL